MNNNNTECNEGWINDVYGVSIDTGLGLTKCTLYEPMITPLYTFIVISASLLCAILLLVALNPGGKKNQNRSVFLTVFVLMLAIDLLGLGVLVRMPIISWFGLSLCCLSLPINTVLVIKKYVSVLDKTKFKGLQQQYSIKTTRFKVEFKKNTKIKIELYSLIVSFLISSACFIVQGIESLKPEGNLTTNYIAYQIGTVFMFIALAQLSMLQYSTVSLFINHIQNINDQVKNIKSQNNDSNSDSNKPGGINEVIKNMKKMQQGSLYSLPIASLWCIHAFVLPVYSSFILPLHCCNCIFAVSFGFFDAYTPKHIKNRYKKTTSMVRLGSFSNKSSTQSSNNTLSQVDDKSTIVETKYAVTPASTLST